MSKTKNHRKLRKRGGGLDDPVPLTGTAAPPAGLGAPPPAGAPTTGTAPQPAAQPASFLSPPPIDTNPPQRPLVPGPVQAQTPVPVPPPTPSFWDKLTSPFKKKPESSSEATATSTSQPTGLFSSKFSLDPRTWFGGKSRRHGKNKKSNKSKKAKKSKSKKH